MFGRRLRFSASLFCLLLASAAATPAQTRARRVGAEDEPPLAQQLTEGDVLRVDTTLVMLPVSVKDRDGRAVQDLTKDDFRIYEEGVEQEIAHFAPVDEPFTVVLMLDTTVSATTLIHEVGQVSGVMFACVSSAPRSQ